MSTLLHNLLPITVKLQDFDLVWFIKLISRDQLRLNREFDPCYLPRSVTSKLGLVNHYDGAFLSRCVDSKNMNRAKPFSLIVSLNSSPICLIRLLY